MILFRDCLLFLGGSFSFLVLLQASNLLTFLPSSILCSYIIENGVCYLTLCDKTYPRSLAFLYLQDLQKKFDADFGAEVDTVGRPYAFIKFETYLTKQRKQFQDTKTQRNLEAMSADLGDLHRIMTKNIEAVIGRGEKLEKVSELSTSLSMESRKYATNARKLNAQAWMRKYGPIFVVLAVILLYLIFRYLIF